MVEAGVVLGAPRRSGGGFGRRREPGAASGCIDPMASLVDVRVEAEVGGERFVIRASNGPLP